MHWLFEGDWVQDLRISPPEPEFRQLGVEGALTPTPPLGGHYGSHRRAAAGRPLQPGLDPCHPPASLQRCWKTNPTETNHVRSQKGGEALDKRTSGKSNSSGSCLRPILQKRRQHLPDKTLSGPSLGSTFEPWQRSVPQSKTCLDHMKPRGSITRRETSSTSSAGANIITSPSGRAGASSCCTCSHLTDSWLSQYEYKCSSAQGNPQLITQVLMFRHGQTGAPATALHMHQSH